MHPKKTRKNLPLSEHFRSCFPTIAISFGLSKSYKNPLWVWTFLTLTELKKENGNSSCLWERGRGWGLDRREDVFFAVHFFHYLDFFFSSPVGEAAAGVQGIEG